MAYRKLGRNSSARKALFRSILTSFFKYGKIETTVTKAKEVAKTVPTPTPKSRDKNTIDMFCKLTDAQIAKYSSTLSKLPELSDLSNFPTYEAFAIYIGNILRDKNNTKNPKTAERIFKALHEKTDFNTN